METFQVQNESICVGRAYQASNKQGGSSRKRPGGSFGGVGFEDRNRSGGVSKRKHGACSEYMLEYFEDSKNNFNTCLSDFPLFYLKSFIKPGQAAFLVLNVLGRLAILIYWLQTKKKNVHRFDHTWLCLVQQIFCTRSPY